ncbi:MFS transporter [Streptomyces sp. NPDC057438]|uniref:MFS transporter n=1 Tax=Streptomyces sp. NPDC057438 TaxID=3346133 RepID=UPI0036B1E388
MVLTKKAPLGGAYRTLWTASTISTLGDGMRFTALPLLSAVLLKDAFAVSLVSAAATLPWLVLSLPAGALADRWDRNRLMVTADLLRACALGAAVLLLTNDRLGLGALLAIALLLGAGEVLFDCASFAVLPQLVDAEQLPKANGRLFTAQTVSRDMAGHVLGSWLFTVGQALPFLLNACSFVLSAAFLSRLPRGPQPSASSSRRLLKEITEGISYIWSDRLVRALTLVAGLINAVYLGQVAIFVLLVTQVLHLPASAYGILISVSALGGVLGGALADLITRRLGTARSLMAALIVVALSGPATAATTIPLVVGVAYFATGFSIMVWNVVAVSLRQELVPARLLGRSIGAYRLFAWGTMPVGAALYGAMADAWGPRTAFAAGSLLTLAALGLVGPALLNSVRSKSSSAS